MKTSMKTAALFLTLAVLMTARLNLLAHDDPGNAPGYPQLPPGATDKPPPGGTNKLLPGMTTNAPPGSSSTPFQGAPH